MSPPGEVSFASNELKDHQPELAARVEAEISAGAAASDDAGRLECRVVDRRQDGRELIGVHLVGDGWTVSFTVSTPPAAGEVKMETVKALRDRGRRSPNYKRATRR